MTHRFAIDLLKEERKKTEMRIRRQSRFLQFSDGLEKLRKRIVEINRAIFVLLKDARK